MDEHVEQVKQVNERYFESLDEAEELVFLLSHGIRPQQPRSRET